MFSFIRKKREKNFEKKFAELDTTVLKEKGTKNSGKMEQFIIERLEEMIEITREIEDEKAEYGMVTSYLSDVQVLEELPEEEHKKLEEIAVNVVQLNTVRNGFLNSSRKLTDAQFALLEQTEKEIPGAIKRLTSNEVYRDTLNRDMKYLEREKSEWILHKEYLGHQQKRLKNLIYFLIGIAVTTAVMFMILQLLFNLDMYYAWMVLAFLTAISICGIYIKIQNNGTELVVAEKNLNRAITLQNKVKIKYVNIANAVDYACEKYHVKSAKELNQCWEYYMEAVKEKEKYQRTNEDLEYFNGRLLRALSQYQLYDTKVWITQAAALVDPKEMVEVKHGLVSRRQKLRGRMDFNLVAIKELKTETEKLVNKVGEMKPQILEILKAIDKLSEAL